MATTHPPAQGHQARQLDWFHRWLNNLHPTAELGYEESRTITHFSCLLSPDEFAEASGAKGCHEAAKLGYQARQCRRYDEGRTAEPYGVWHNEWPCT